MLNNKLTINLIGLATLLALIVIQLGAYTRLKDAGLGCPDWPGCYGKLIVPHKNQLTAPFQHLSNTLDSSKAWAEMIHRYAVASLTLLIFAIATLLLQKRNLPQQPIKTVFFLLMLLLFQALLGKWTVTLRLHPLIVMGHLIGGFSLFGLLWWLYLQTNVKRISLAKNNAQILQPWVKFALVTLILQISLGGWTSSNYAAFVCPDFPQCQAHWWPDMNFADAFQLDFNFHKNYEGGLLPTKARTAIQFVHRLGALFTGCTIIILTWKIHNFAQNISLKRLAYAALTLFCLQFSLGILNVLWYLPLPIAMAHNAIASLLFILLFTVYYLVRSNSY